MARPNTSSAGLRDVQSSQNPSSPYVSTFSSRVAESAVGPAACTGTVLASTIFNDELRRFGLLSRFPSLVSGLSSGFNIGIPSLHHSRLQANHSSALAQPAVIQDAIARELGAGRYRGPFSASELQALIGPFQSSPLGLVPKGDSDWRIIQDFSRPRAGESINSHLCSDNWPTAWGAARDVVRTRVNLDRGTLASSIQGRQVRGGVAFFASADGEEHVEDYAFPLRNHTANANSDLVASLSAITSITSPPGVPWKASKDVDFCPNPIYIGFQWFIAERCVGLADAKRLKYLASLQL
ncbi:unnamed protein product [Tilletia caries]|nr:unnamed protein product [Tilletia caries]